MSSPPSKSSSLSKNDRKCVRNGSSVSSNSPLRKRTNLPRSPQISLFLLRGAKKAWSEISTPSFYLEDNFWLSDKHLIFDVCSVDLFWGWSEENFKTTFNTGHNSGDLAGRNDDLFLHKLRRVGNLHLGAVDRSADEFDLISGGQ